ncbi:MAG: hypothetical protein ACI33P_11590 [Lysinibacillus sp.]
MKLENERRHVVGSRSVLTDQDGEYAELDAGFLELIKEMNKLQ